MSIIKGKIKVETEGLAKHVGMGLVKVISINPDRDELKEKIGIDPKEDSNMFDYIGESKEGNVSFRVDVWTEEAETGKKAKVTFFLEDAYRTNKDETKEQFINNIGRCTWAADEEDLAPWFANRPYRVARVGEENLYRMLHSWLSLDFRHDDTEVQLDWKELMSGNINSLKELIGGEMVKPFVVMYTVKLKEADEGGFTEYQSVYNRGFLPEYTLKYFTTTNYNAPAVTAALASQEKVKFHEKFVLDVTDSEHGCKEVFSLEPMKEFIASEHAVAGDETMMSPEEEEKFSEEMDETIAAEAMEEEFHEAEEEEDDVPY